jgi:hypothetical protein
VLTLGNAVAQHFGDLSIGAETIDSDTLSLPSGSVQAYKFSASSSPRIIGTTTDLQVERLAVSGAIFQDVLVDQHTFSEQPLQFDDVVFTGYSATEVQLSIAHPGASILNPFSFTNVDFDDAANPDGVTGFFARVNDTDGITTFLHVNIFGPDSGLSLSLFDLLNGGLLSLFPPS